MAVVPGYLGVARGFALLLASRKFSCNERRIRKLATVAEVGDIRRQRQAYSLLTRLSHFPGSTSFIQQEWSNSNSKRKTIPCGNGLGQYRVPDRVKLPNLC